MPAFRNRKLVLLLGEVICMGLCSSRNIQESGFLPKHQNSLLRGCILYPVQGYTKLSMLKIFKRAKQDKIV